MQLRDVYRSRFVRAGRRVPVFVGTAPPAGALKTFAVAVAGAGAVTPATLVRTRGVQTGVVGVGAVVSSLVRSQRALAATVTGHGAATIGVSRFRGLAVGVAGAGAVSVTRLAVTRTLAVAVAGHASVAADLTKIGQVIKAFAVAVAGHSAVTATHVRTVGLRAGVAGHTAVSPAVSHIRRFAAAIVAAAALAVDLAVFNKPTPPSLEADWTGSSREALVASTAVEGATAAGELEGTAGVIN